MTVDITELIEATRPANTDDITPAQLQPFILFLLVEAERLTVTLESVRLDEKSTYAFITTVGGALYAEWLTNDKFRTLQGIENDLVAFEQRLHAYLEDVNDSIADGNGNSPSYATPVVLPLLRGYFPKQSRIPGSRSVLCLAKSECDERYPDFANLFIIRNELEAFTEFSDYQNVQFFKDVQENAKTVLGGAIAKKIEEFLEKNDAPDAPAEASWKPYAIGAGVTVALLGLYKLLR